MALTIAKKLKFGGISYNLLDLLQEILKTPVRFQITSHYITFPTGLEKITQDGKILTFWIYLIQKGECVEKLDKEATFKIVPLNNVIKALVEFDAWDNIIELVKEGTLSIGYKKYLKS